MATGNSVDQQLQLLYDERDAIMLQLKNDAVSGAMPNDSFGGQNVDFTGWRDGLYKRLDQIKKDIIALQPFEIVSQGW